MTSVHVCVRCLYESDRAGSFYYKKTPAACVCKTCYFKAYGAVHRVEIYQTRTERTLKAREIMRMYKQTPHYIEAKQRLRERVTAGRAQMLLELQAGLQTELNV